MSEPTEQDEPTEPTVTDVPEPDQPTEEEQHEEEQHEADVPFEEPEPSSEPAADSEKEMKAVGKKLDNERDRHAKKLGEILGDASTDTLPCPLCFDGLMGFVLPMDAGNLPDEQKAAALSFLGEAMPSELREAEGVVECDRCAGIGQLRYPTKNPHVQNQTCPKCSGNGYVPVQAAQQNVTYLPETGNQGNAVTAASGWSPTADQWGRPFGHQHYGVPPASVGGS